MDKRFRATEPSAREAAMAMQAVAQDAGVKVTMNFNDRAFNDLSVMDDVHRENIRMHLVPVEVHLSNMRKAGHPFTLERNALTLVRDPSKLTDYSSTQEVIEQSYYPECSALVKKLTGATHVGCFGFAVRGGPDNSPAGKRQPVMNAHIDYTVDTAGAVAERIAPDHLKGTNYRFRAINVWRPIAPVERNPLAVVDGASVTRNDLFLCRLNASRSGMADSYGWNMAHSPAQRWYYAPDMTPDEALVFTLIDSVPSAVQFGGHTSFNDPNSKPDAKPRQSIEVRTIAYFATN
jgi:hypothetical protein